MKDAGLWNYDAFRELLRRERLPTVLVDLDRFDANVEYFVRLARQAGKTIRVASKSLRVPALLARAIAQGRGTIRGLMCYSSAEAAFLAEQGMDDLLLGYPAVQRQDLVHATAVMQQGRSITFMVDCAEHVQQLAEGWGEIGLTQPLRVCIDIDVSWRPGGAHVGAQRSPIRSIDGLQRMLDTVEECPAVKLVGVMTYEAHLAGVPDANPFAPLRSGLLRLMKFFARPDVRRQRERIRACLERRKIELEFVNGGGTGSFEDTVQEPWLTEVTVGSGLLQPQLFDYYRNLDSEKRRAAAICFALPITRLPQVDRATCHSANLVASGPPGSDRLPLPCLPEGLSVDRREGFGEVQTPLVVPPALHGKFNIGDPICFRPAKAGELAEHFEEYLLVQQGRIVDRVRTYRGWGRCF